MHIIKQHESHNELKYACEQCHENFSTLDNLRAHRRVHHIAESEHPLCCPECSRRFISIPLAPRALLRKSFLIRGMRDESDFNHDSILLPLN